MKKYTIKEKTKQKKNWPLSPGLYYQPGLEMCYMAAYGACLAKPLVPVGNTNRDNWRPSYPGCPPGTKGGPLVPD